MQSQILEGVCLPARHIGFDFVDRVPPWGRPESANFFPASSSVNLCSPSHVEPRVFFKFHRSRDIVMDFSAADPKFGILAEVLEASLEIIKCEAQISIEL